MTSSTAADRPLRFVRRGEIVSLANVPPTRTLLQVLREDLALTGTKEGCGEGDCGACTVVIGEAAGRGVQYRAINSCIRLAHSVDGLALWTVEDLAAPDGTLHPAQQAMVNAHGSQCGFCTPGFVMSLFAMYQSHGGPITRETARTELSGNLCRCTGYRPILDAAQQMASLPPARVDEGTLLQLLEQLAHSGRALQGDWAYMQPDTLAQLVQLRAAHPQAQIVAGCTDVGLWVTKQHRSFAQVLDVTRVAELREIRHHADHLEIGAAATLTAAFEALLADRPHLASFTQRFAGLPVRNAGTLGGNVANGSPIGDSMPLLLALGASVVLARAGEGGVVLRELPLNGFYTGYRTHQMAPDEVLAAIKVPRPEPGEFLRVYKISKRYDDDISAVCLAIHLRLEGGAVADLKIGVGGVAATPVCAIKTEALCAQQIWSSALSDSAKEVLMAEFEPLSDMRASAAYRRAALGGLWQRFWLETQGVTQINLESLTVIGEAT